MMQLNPLFFNLNSEFSTAEQSIDTKLNNTKYLFSDVIKIKLDNIPKDKEAGDPNSTDDIDQTALKRKNVDNNVVSYEYNYSTELPPISNVTVSSSIDSINLNFKSEATANLSHQENKNINDKIYQNNLSVSKLEKFVSDLNKPVSNSTKNNKLIENKKAKEIVENKKDVVTTNKKPKSGIDFTEIIKKVSKNKKVKISLKLEKNIAEKLKNLKGVNLKKLKKLQKNTKVKKSLIIEVSKAKNSSKENTLYLKKLNLDTLKNKYNVKISITNSITKLKDNNLLKTTFLNKKLMGEFSKPNNFMRQLKTKLTDIFPVNGNRAKSSTIAVSGAKNIKNSFLQTNIHSININNQKNNDRLLSLNTEENVQTNYNKKSAQSLLKNNNIKFNSDSNNLFNNNTKIIDINKVIENKNKFNENLSVNIKVNKNLEGVKTVDNLSNIISIGENRPSQEFSNIKKRTITKQNSIKNKKLQTNLKVNNNSKSSKTFNSSSNVNEFSKKMDSQELLNTKKNSKTKENLLQNKINKELPIDIKANNIIESSNAVNNLSNLNGLPKKNYTPKALNIKKITKTIQNLIQNKNNKNVTLKLSPDEFGKLEIRLKFSDKKIVVNMNVENEVSKHMIQTNINQLRQAIEQTGMQLSEVFVSLSNDNKKNEKESQSKVKKQIVNMSPLENMLDTSGKEIIGKEFGYNTYEYLI